MRGNAAASQRPKLRPWWRGRKYLKAFDNGYQRGEILRHGRTRWLASPWTVFWYLVEAAEFVVKDVSSDRSSTAIVE